MTWRVRAVQTARTHLGRVLRRLADLDGRVAHGREEEREDLDNPRLEDAAEAAAERLDGEDGALPHARVLLVLDRVANPSDEPKLPQRADAAPLDRTRQAVRRAAPIRVLARAQTVGHERLDQPRRVVAGHLDERDEALADGDLDRLGRRLERVDEPLDDARQARVGRVEMAREPTEEDNDGLDDAIARLAAPALRRAEPTLERVDQTLQVRGAVVVDDAVAEVEHREPYLGRPIAQRLAGDEQIDDRAHVGGLVQRRKEPQRLGDRHARPPRVLAVQRLLADHAELVELGKQELGLCGVSLFNRSTTQRPAR